MQCGLVVPRLGPIELDANGEAAAATVDASRFWKVEPYGSGYRLFVQAGFIQLHWGGSTLEELAEVITRNAPHSETLRRWCEQVGWFRGEVGTADTLTCGPLRMNDKGHGKWYWGNPGESIQVHYSSQRPGEWVGILTDATRHHEEWLSAYGASPTEAAQALAAAIEASTDPAVVRFREEHWTCEMVDMAHWSGPERIPADGPCLVPSCVGPTYWNAPDAMVHWVKRMTPEQLERWKKWEGVPIQYSLSERDMAGCTAQQVLSRVLCQCPGAFALLALVAELIATHDYFPEEAARRARYLVARTLEPLSLLIATPEEQVRACRTAREGAPW